jgi:predicted DNA-binding transcriptional regulator AlpA
MRAPAQAVYLTAADLRERYHCSRMTDANFPKPTKFGVGGVRRRWLAADVQAWVQNRLQYLTP